jgi:Flp pilus assembly protein TadG
MMLARLLTFCTMCKLTRDSVDSGAVGDAARGIASVPEVKLERACRPCRRNRRGAAAVEFAVVAPVFFLMVFGMIEFGRAIMVKQVVTNASREGARLAVLDSPSPTASTVVSTVKNYMQNAGVSATAATVTINPSEPTTAGYGQPVTVTVQIPFSSVSWLPKPLFLGASTQLSASTVMRRETVTTTTTP